MLPPAIEARLLPAAAVLWLERAWVPWARSAALLWGGWVLAALFGLVELLPGPVRVSALALLALATLALIGAAVALVPLPDRAALFRRLERASDARLGSLALLDERAVGAGEDGLGARMWARARERAARTRPRLDAPRLERLRGDANAMGLAMALLALTGAALLAAGSQADARLAAAFSRYPTDLSGVRMTATLDPPAYAGASRRRVAFGPGERASVTLLPGTRLSVDVTGPAGEWRLRAPGGASRLVSEAALPWVAERGRYHVMFGARPVAALDVRLARDAPPRARLVGMPAATPTGALRIAYRLADDHGRMAVAVRIERGRVRRDVPIAQEAASGEGVAFIDLTADPLAGQEVALRLVARDGAGNVGLSQPVQLRLPRRLFRHPVAREIIAARAGLLEAPAAREPTMQRLTAIAARPERFDEELAVFAALRAATYRLGRDGSADTIRSTARLLWDAAVALEDGGASRALDDLRGAMDRLADAIAKGDEGAMRALADALGGAMAQYLQSQIQRMMENPEAAQQMLETAQALDAGTLGALFEELKDRMAAGDEEGARALLAELRQLMETIQFGGLGVDPAAVEAAQAAGRAADEARRLREEQQALQAETIAETVRRSVTGEPGAMAELERAQRALEEGAQALGEGAGVPGEAAEAMARAADAMGEAREALGRGEGEAALAAQGRAMRALAQAQGAAEQAAAAAGGAAGAMQPGAAGSGLDPLGRPGAGFGAGQVEIADPARARRIEAIRALLEERAADPRRSDEERAYYRRLLKRF